MALEKAPVGAAAPVASTTTTAEDEAAAASAAAAIFSAIAGSEPEPAAVVNEPAPVAVVSEPAPVPVEAQAPEGGGALSPTQVSSVDVVFSRTCSQRERL